MVLRRPGPQGRGDERRADRGTFDKITGKFIREDPDAVWIGNKKIAKSKLREDIAPRFDPDGIEKLKAEYVDRKIRDYHRERTLFETRLKDDAIHELRGYIRYKGKWLSVRNTVERIYRDILEEKNKPAPQMEERHVSPVKNRKTFRNTDSPFKRPGQIDRMGCPECKEDGRAWWKRQKRIFFDFRGVERTEYYWIPCPVCNPSGRGNAPEQPTVL